LRGSLLAAALALKRSLVNPGIVAFRGAFAIQGVVALPGVRVVAVAAREAILSQTASVVLVTLRVVIAIVGTRVVVRSIV
jgi:hypothetical protein